MSYVVLFTHTHTRASTTPSAARARSRAPLHDVRSAMSAVLALNTAGLIPLRARASVARKNARATVAPKVRARATRRVG